MPIYEWYCDECSIKWERILRMSDELPKKTKCPRCKKLSERLFEQATPVIFKGGGWSDPVKNMGGYKKGNSDEHAQMFIESSKRRMESGNEHYARYELDPKKWNEGVKNSDLEKDKGGAVLTPLTEEAAASKRKWARKLTADAYDKHGSGQKPYNPNVKNQ